MNKFYQQVVYGNFHEWGPRQQNSELSVKPLHHRIVSLLGSHFTPSMLVSKKYFNRILAESFRQKEFTPGCLRMNLAISTNDVTA